MNEVKEKEFLSALQDLSNAAGYLAEIWDDEVDGDMPVRVGFGQHTNRTGRFKLFLQGPARNQRLLARTEAPIRERTDLT